MQYLESHGMVIHRTTISSDMAYLTEAGVDVITIRSAPNKYFIGQRQLQLPELKLLVAAVSSSKFITQKKSAELIDKIGTLTSKNQATELKCEMYTDASSNHTMKKYTTPLTTYKNLSETKKYWNLSILNIQQAKI